VKRTSQALHIIEQPYNSALNPIKRAKPEYEVVIVISCALGRILEDVLVRLVTSNVVLL